MGIPRPFDINTLLDRLERHRGRTIDLHPTVMRTGGPCGLWIAERDRDILVYPEATSDDHQNHIILHEVGHMTAGHEGAGPTADLVRAIAPTVDPTLVRHILARHSYPSLQELEAELIADFIRAAAAGADPGRSPAAMEDTILQLFGA